MIWIRNQSRQALALLVVDKEHQKAYWPSPRLNNNKIPWLLSFWQWSSCQVTLVFIKIAQAEFSPSLQCLVHPVKLSLWMSKVQQLILLSTFFLQCAGNAVRFSWKKWLLLELNPQPLQRKATVLASGPQNAQFLLFLRLRLIVTKNLNPLKQPTEKSRYLSQSKDCQDSNPCLGQL